MTESLPSYFRFISPLMQVLARYPDGIRAREARELVADSMKLSEAQRALMLPSGKGATYRNRCGWAFDRLKRGGYARSLRRGVWQLTPEGSLVSEQHPTGLPEELVLTLHQKAHDIRLTPEQPDTEVATAKAQSDSQSTPDEQLEDALEAIKESVSAELLNTMRQIDPAQFEQLVLDVLHGMGYGLNRDSLQRTPISQDGGIDGVISLDRLGLEKVYIQAKRWQNNVGRPEIQGFYGALAGRRATKGVFITTSAFSREALEFADQVSDSIVLVDGPRLAELMVEYEIGVSSTRLRIPKIDSDYFADD